VRSWVLFLAAVAGCRGGDSAPTTDEGTSGGADTSTSATSSAGSSSGIASSEGGADSTTGDPVEPPPPCGSLDYAWRGVVAGPGDDAFESELEAAAVQRDRVHVAIASLPSGLGTDVSIAVDDEAARAAVESFVAGEGWDFEAASGVAPRDAIARWEKATGAFAGVAAAADAYRYGTLRDQGYACEDIEAARAQLGRALEGLHLATALTGVDGLVVRAIAHRDWPGVSSSPTTPIFDENGDPLPLEKNNGTWREDNSGAHPDFVWEDSGSRDQLIGWIAGYAAAWEVVRDDPTFDDAVKDRLRSDARAIAVQLMTVRPSGYDLEIWDPEGRPTLHGYLHEHNLEGTYVGFFNGQHAIMAAGIVAGLARIAEDPEIDAYLVDALVEDRKLVDVAADNLLVDFGVSTNWSNYNMAFTGAWLVGQALDHEMARADLRRAADRLYAWPRSVVPVATSGQALFDLVFALAGADASGFADTVDEPDAEAIERALVTLRAFPAAPAWNFARENCDADEIAAGTCTLEDGTVVEVLGEVGHSDALVVDQAVPIAIRPPSNFYWRSNPYEPNGGGDGTTIPSAADFRFAYWLGRWTRRPPGAM
jgi:hypothetical protein